jgi:hypothetical protein
MNSPLINLTYVYKWFYNRQTITVINPDGSTFVTTDAIMRVTDDNMKELDHDETWGHRVKVNWLLFKTVVPSAAMPQINTKIIDSTGTIWYVNDIENKYFGNCIKLFTESRAGQLTQNEQYPPVPTTTTTLPPANVTITSNANPAAFGQNITITVTVSP